MPHQKQAVELGLRHPRFAFFLEPGLGKTIAILALIQAWKERGFAWPTAVVAPKSVLWSAWREDAKHFPDLEVEVIHAAGATNRRKIIERSTADAMVMNYETFKSNVGDLSAKNVGRLVLDESSKLRNPTTAISKTAFAFSMRTHVKSVYLLSGTPAPNGQHEYYGQVRCVSRDVFGMSYWRHLSDYFHPIKKTINGVERVAGHRLNVGAEPRFAAAIQSVSWSLRAEDCLGLPEERDVVRKVAMSPDEIRIYAEVLTEFQASFDDEADATPVNANARTMKLRQITGGHFYLPDGKAKALESSKLEALESIVDEHEGMQLVIWAEFTAEIDRIVSLLDARAGGVAAIDGRTSAELRAGRIAAFQAGRLQYLVCHPAAAGHGVTLTAARYDVFYSHSFSLEQHEQARKRIHRINQRWPVCHHHLVAENTIDEKTLRVLKRKQRASEAMKELLVERREPLGV